MRRAASSVGLAAALACGCAQIRVTSEVEVIAKQGGESIVIGPSAGAVTARGALARWTQTGKTVEFVVHKTEQCAVLRHEPVVRVERITKKSGGAIYWEFGIGAALLAGGLAGLIKPELFGQPSINAMGESVRDVRAGYRIGGIFTGLSAIAIGAGIYDIVRTRDEVRYTDAYRTHVGEAAECDAPTEPLASRTIELIVGEWTQTATSDDRGRARFVLPDEADLPSTERSVPKPGLSESVIAALDDGGFFDADKMSAAQAPSPERFEIAVGGDGGPTLVPESRTVDGVIRLGGQDALAFDFVVPYESKHATGRSGEVVLEPQPLRRAPPRPRKKAAEAPRP